MIDICGICHKRPAEMSAVFDGGPIIGLCGTCYERGKDEEENVRYLNSEHGDDNEEDDE